MHNRQQREYVLDRPEQGCGVRSSVSSNGTRRWRVVLQDKRLRQGRRVSLGYFSNARDAATVYDFAILILGHPRPVNFPREAYLTCPRDALLKVWAGVSDLVLALTDSPRDAASIAG